MDYIYTTIEEIEVYWQAVFSSRNAPIQKSTVTVILPESVSNQIMHFQSFGVPTSSEKIDSRTVRYIAKDALQPREKMEVEIIFPHGIIQTQPANWQVTQERNRQRREQQRRIENESAIHKKYSYIY